MKNKKIFIALTLVALVGIVGGTIAYFTSTATFTNDFITGKYATSVTEIFESPDNWIPGTITPNVVNVTNDGEIDVAVRVSYTEKWVSKNNTELGNTRDGEQIALFAIGEEWEEALDGKYYYKYALKPGETTSDFISSVTFNPNFTLKEGIDYDCNKTIVDGKSTIKCLSNESGYAGARYTLEMVIETIQYDQKWQYRTLNYEIGEVVTIGTENFNVIRDNGDSITMLSKYCVGSDYKQNENRYMANVTFANDNAWRDRTDIIEIDVHKHEGNAKNYVSGYVSYLQAELKNTSISGSLITFNQIKNLGCVGFGDGYSLSCPNTNYTEWLINGQIWWVPEFNPTNPVFVYAVAHDGYYNSISYNRARACIRPLITVSKEAFKNL